MCNSSLHVLHVAICPVTLCTHGAYHGSISTEFAFFVKDLVSCVIGTYSCVKLLLVARILRRYNLTRNLMVSEIDGTLNLIVNFVIIN